MRNELFALAVGVVLGLGVVGGDAAPAARTAGSARTARQATIEAAAAARARVPHVVVRRADVRQRLAERLDELGRGKPFERLRGYFPATPRGAQMAAYTVLADDLPDATEAGVFARELLPELVANASETAAAVRVALRAMPRGDGELYAAKEMLINFISGSAALDRATITSILTEYLGAEDPASEAYSLAESRLRLANDFRANVEPWRPTRTESSPPF